MKKIIISIILIIWTIVPAYTNEEIDPKKTIYYFSGLNYYYMTDNNADWFINWKFSIYKAMTDDKELWKIFNALFPKNSCYISRCWVNKKKLLFEAVLKYNYYEKPEFMEEINIAKTRYTDSSILNNDLKEIEESVNILIKNKKSSYGYWRNIWSKNNGTKICNTTIENWITTYNFSSMFKKINMKVFDHKHYILTLPLNIDTWFQNDLLTPNMPSWKDNTYKINTLEGLWKISSISVLNEINLNNSDYYYFSFDFNYIETKNELEKKLSKIYNTYNNQALKIYDMKVLLFYENNEWELVYMSDLNPSYNEKEVYFQKSCENYFKINNEESFDRETYNQWINPAISNDNNKLFLKKIDNIFRKLDKRYDFWNLNSKIDKKNYYLMLIKLKDWLEVYNEKLSEKINLYSVREYKNIVDNKEKIEKLFEKKMFIDYLIKKSKFRIEEWLVDYYEWKDVND
jgi:hypothetical protein